MVGAVQGGRSGRPGPARLARGRGDRRGPARATRTSPPGRSVTERQVVRRAGGHVHGNRPCRRRAGRRPRRWRQRRSRSAWSALTASASGSVPPWRSPALPSTSSTVGRAASATSLERRYSWSDWWAAVARWRSTAWVSAGTSLIWMFGMEPLWSQDGQFGRGGTGGGRARAHYAATCERSRPQCGRRLRG